MKGNGNIIQNTLMSISFLSMNKLKHTHNLLQTTKIFMAYYRTQGQDWAWNFGYDMI